MVVLIFQKISPSAWRDPRKIEIKIKIKIWRNEKVEEGVDKWECKQRLARADIYAKIMIVRGLSYVAHDNWWLLWFFVFFIKFLDEDKVHCSNVFTCRAKSCYFLSILQGPGADSLVCMQHVLPVLFHLALYLVNKYDKVWKNVTITEVVEIWELLQVGAEDSKEVMILKSRDSRWTFVWIWGFENLRKWNKIGLLKTCFMVCKWMPVQKCVISF